MRESLCKKGALLASLKAQVENQANEHAEWMKKHESQNKKLVQDVNILKVQKTCLEAEVNKLKTLQKQRSTNIIITKDFRQVINRQIGQCKAMVATLQKEFQTFQKDFQTSALQKESQSSAIIRNGSTDNSSSSSISKGTGGTPSNEIRSTAESSLTTSGTLSQGKEITSQGDSVKINGSITTISEGRESGSCSDPVKKNELPAGTSNGKVANSQDHCIKRESTDGDSDMEIEPEDTENESAKVKVEKRKNTDESVCPTTSKKQDKRDTSVIRAKLSLKLRLESHRGVPGNMLVMSVIGENKHIVTFGDSLTMSTVSAPYAIVSKGKKTWYEVVYTNCNTNNFCGQQIGWATPKFAYCNLNSDTGVGDCEQSYGFDPFQGYKYHGGRGKSWGSMFKDNWNERVVGVAVDLELGEVRFSMNGMWNYPMGLAFKDLPPDIKLFPALSGCDATMSVNFGERAFTYGPPDPSFDSLNVLLTPALK